MPSPQPCPSPSSTTRRTSAVIAEAVRRSALAGYAERFAAVSAASGGELSIRERPFVSQLNLRTGTDAAGIQRFAAVLGFPLPTVPNSVASLQDRRALWLGPHQWPIARPGGQPAAIQHGQR